MIIGIDPGKNTGIAVLNGESMFSLTTTRDELLETFKSLIQDLNVDKNEILAVVEEQQARGRFASDFQVGVSAGYTECMLRLMSVPFVTVKIQKWQKGILGIFPKGESKATAKKYVTARFPDGVKRTEHEYDAICIALYLYGGRK